jgi:hypothetical protein
MTGASGAPEGLSLLWRNTGNGFERTIFDLPGVEEGCAAWGDATMTPARFLDHGLSRDGPIASSG